MALDQTMVQGSVTLRKMKSGATASISLSSTMQLFQLYTKGAGGVYSFAPSWENNNPVVSVNVSSSSGYQIEILGVVWKLNGQNVTQFNSPGQSDVFAVSGSAPWTLTIKKNIADIGYLNLNSGTLTADVTFSDGQGGSPQTVTKAEVIRVQQAVEGGYTVFINTNGKNYVNADAATDAERNAVLTAVCYYGLLPYNGANFEWHDSVSSTTAIGTGDTLTVRPDMVNGSQLFICRGFVDGSEVDAEAVVIVDSSDPLLIVAKAQQKSGGNTTGIPLQENVTSVDVADANDSTEITFSVIKSDGSAYNVNPTRWEAQKRHAGTMNLIKQIKTGTAPNEVIQPYTDDYSAAEESTVAVTDGYSVVSASNSATIGIIVYDADFYTISSGSTVKDEVVVTATADFSPAAS